MKPETIDIRKGAVLLVQNLDGLLEDNPELSNMHEAFEHFCMNKYSIGDETTQTKSGGKNDCGIDFYSVNDATYHVAQCKIPVREYLEAHPEKPKTFGASAVTDARDALGYLLGGKKLKANEKVKYLYGQVQTDRARPDFSLVFFVLVFGRLNDRAKKGFEELRQQYADHNVRLVLQEINDIVDDFLLGSTHSRGRIELELRTDRDNILSSHNYCYFLANARDVFEAFQKYGWRLFDLNLRYEIRNSSVNGDIVNSLTHHSGRKNFHHFNNGLIVVCTHYARRGDAVLVKNAQVINGLQTVKSIYNAVTNDDVKIKDLESECRVQVKVIKTEKVDFVADVVRATNNQNPMAPRNLRSNEKEQRILKADFAALQPRWFYQVKQGEWESLTQEGARFFKTITGYPAVDFRPDPKKKAGRVLDNQYAAKAWLAFIGFSDLAGDRTTHYFAKSDVYRKAFISSPSDKHWKALADTTNFRDSLRTENLEMSQASASQYLLAYLTWEFVRNFIPAPSHYRREALDEGVRQRTIAKSDGSITSPAKVQEDFLSENSTYQTWRLLANMKEVLVESLAYILAMKYGSLHEAMAERILRSSEAESFKATGSIKEVAQSARNADSFGQEELFSRSLRFLHHAAGQYWEDKRNQIAATSRLRTLLLRPDMIMDFKEKILEINRRVGLDKPWKPADTSFLDSLPAL
ncbi:AIPR family protein [Candidatus Eisenbacteria bacterium]|uniref:AIPR family protein n=1 Tax=Eiseniibacteriota bacterium TaxID=2212470 RepID=A0ABV6YNF8_UNCEI